MSFINTPESMSDFAGKAEKYLMDNVPNQIDSAISAIHIGKNADAQLGSGAGWKVTGASRNASPEYFEVPEKMIDEKTLVDKSGSSLGFETRCSDEVRRHIESKVSRLVDSGVNADIAKKTVMDSLEFYGWKDKDGKFVAEPVVKGVNDATIEQLNLPYWNITQLQKEYRQPMLRSSARRLVSEVGVPNVWADAIAIWTRKYEGSARVSNVGRTLGQHTGSRPSSTRVGQIVSEFINMVADFETADEDKIFKGLTGNPLSSKDVGENEKYTRYCLEQLHDALIYFGDADSGFDGLKQNATTTIYSGEPFQHIFEDSSNTHKGADMIEALMSFISTWMEELNFLPTKAVINCSTTMAKCLRFAMVNKQYQPVSAMKFLQDWFNEKFVKFNGDAVSEMKGFTTGLEFHVDQMLDGSTATRVNPFNPRESGETLGKDLMYVTFPSLRSELEGNGISDCIMAPVAISNMVLPFYFASSRNGNGRTMLKRVGSLLCPVENTVKIVKGMGVRDYT